MHVCTIQTKKMSDSKTKIKILEFLKKKDPMDYNINEIAGKIKIHRNTARKYIKKLVAEGSIIVSRTMGKINLYTIAKGLEENDKD